MKFSLLYSIAAYPIAVFICYWMCLRGPLIFDDYEIEPRLQKFKWNWKWIRGRQRPLSSLFLAIQGKWPNTLRGLHGTNQILHWLCAFHVEQIAKYAGLDDGLAFFAGLLFCVHPLASNAVGWITGRHSLVAAFFGLGVAHAVLAGYPLLAFPLLTLAFFSKEDAAGYGPGIAALLIVCGEWWYAAALFGCGIAGFIVEWPWGSQYRREHSLIRRLLINTGSQLMEDIGLPGGLKQPLHALGTLAATTSRLPLWALGLGQAPYHGSGTKFDWKIPAGCLAFGVTFAFLLAYSPIAAVLVATGPWLIYLFCPLPDILMEHRNYSQVAGICLGLALLFDRGPWWILAIALISFASLTAIRATAYSSVIQYWTESASHATGDASRAFQEMGAWMKLKGEDRQSEVYLREAIRLNPRLAPALNNLGWLLIKKGSESKDTGIADEGAACLERCTKVAPRYALGWQDYGLWMENIGKPEAAYECYQRALEIDPAMESAYNRLGLGAFYRKDFAAAHGFFDKAHQLNPKSLEYFYNRAVTIKHEGHPEIAAELFSQLPKPCPITVNMLPPEFAK